MSTLLEVARIAVLATLGLVVVSSIVLAPRDLVVFLSAAEGILLIMSGYLLLRNWWDWFTITSGVLTVVATTGIALGNGNGFIWPWSILGLGLAAIMVGNHTCRSTSVLLGEGTSEGAMEGEFRRVAIKGYLRILQFLGLVWIISLLILLISLNAAIGTVPSWLMAILALLAMVALALLALARRTEA